MTWKIRDFLPNKGFFLVAIASISILFLWFSVTKFYSYFFVSKPLSQIDYFWRSVQALDDVRKQVSLISQKLHDKDYGEEGGPWGVILAHDFYAYSLVNLYLQSPKDTDFLEFARKELRFIYSFMKQDGRNHFLNQGTNLEYGIIYQGHKLQVLVSLVILWLDEYKNELESDALLLSQALRNSPKFSAESYPGIAWFVDNVNAYYSLHIVDVLHKKNGRPAVFQQLLADWMLEMDKQKDHYGVTRAEAYGYDSDKNQSRGCAQGWLLSYMYEMNRKYFDEQYPLFNTYFYREKFWLGFVADVANWEARTNAFSWGPSLFWYSASAIVLSLPLYKISEDADKFQKILRTLVLSEWYDHGRYTTIPSLLLDSLNLWGKTHTTWGDKLLK